MKKNNFLYFTTNNLLDIKAVFEELLENKGCFENGLCYWIHTVKYRNSVCKDYNKYYVAENFVLQNRPKSFLRTLKRRFFGGSSYFWTKDKIKPRIKFIKKHIKLIENELVNRSLIAINSDETIIM